MSSQGEVEAESFIELPYKEAENFSPGQLEVEHLEDITYKVPKNQATAPQEAKTGEDIISKGAGNLALENADSAQVVISIKDETTKLESTDKQSVNPLIRPFSDKEKRYGRITIFWIGIGFLMVGRFTVPEIEIHCIEDKALTILEFANDFINAPGNGAFRGFFQFLCSLLIDVTFLLTMGYWVLRGKSLRLPVTLAIFYVTRAAIQKVWFGPFPPGFYWDTPGLPSLVVPYGRGSDFFFSGHSGFLVICACEWHKNKVPQMRNFAIVLLIYTILVLLVYRIHYSIDIFAGVIFADWCFFKVDLYKDVLDNLVGRTLLKLKNLFTKGKAKPPKTDLNGPPPSETNKTGLNNQK